MFLVRGQFFTLVIVIFLSGNDYLLIARAQSKDNAIRTVISTSPYNFIRSLKSYNQSDTVSSSSTITTTATTFDTNYNARNISVATSNDLLCNNDSEFACICQYNTGNLLTQYNLCNQLIETDELPIIEMNIRRVNLSARLHTNETYESYFKRRIAAVVSKYCEQQADECMATTLRLKKENVVLLSVKKNKIQSTVIGFVISKSQKRSLLSSEKILDTTKVKYILSAQLAALSRVLGGLRIERVETVTMKKIFNNGGATSERDNTRLLIILTIVAIFLIITYSIAAIRVCRDCSEKRRAKKNANKINKTSDMPNYGTCTSSKHGQTITNADTENAVTVTNILKNAQLPSEMSDAVSEEIHVMDTYRMVRMFQCDPSQLPAEETLTLSQTSDNLTMMHGSKSLPEAAEFILCHPHPDNNRVFKYTIETDVDRNSLEKSDQEDEVFIGLPQKYAEMSKNDEEVTVDHHNHTQKLDAYSDQPHYDYSEEKSAAPLESLNSPWDQTKMVKTLETVWDQSNAKTEPMPIDLPWNELEVAESSDRVWNQTATTDEPAWLIEESSSNVSDQASSSFYGATSDPAQLYDEETIILELHPTNEEIESEIQPGTAYLKRVSLKDSPNDFTDSENSNIPKIDIESKQLIQKSQTAHKFSHWSSDSDDDDDESDAYHKLSEFEDDSESGKRPESLLMNNDEEAENFTKNREILEDKEPSINMSLRSPALAVDGEEPCYERLQESPVTPNSFDSNLTDDGTSPQQFVYSTSTDDLK